MSQSSKAEPLTLVLLDLPNLHRLAGSDPADLGEIRVHAAPPAIGRRRISFRRRDGDRGEEDRRLPKDGLSLIDNRDKPSAAAASPPSRTCDFCRSIKRLRNSRAWRISSDHHDESVARKP